MVQTLVKRFNRPGTAPGVKAFAHITGGGFIDNLPRVLPARVDVVIRKDSWDIPPLFRLLQAKGNVSETELYQVFNMGIGMVALVDPDRADAALRVIRAAGHSAWVIGEIVAGSGRTRLT